MKGQVFTVAKLHYVNGVVYFTANETRTDIPTLAKHSSETTKSGDVLHPVVRVRTLMRLAEGIGLVRRIGKKGVEVTELGQKYYQARAKEKWSLSTGQKKILREHILSRPAATPTIHAITSLLALVQKGYAGEELGHQYATAIGKGEAWQSKVTYDGFTKFGLSYLEELGLLEPGIQLQSISANPEKALANPAWSRDELILALDLYFRVPGARGSKSHPECIKLSQLLNSLPIHHGQAHGTTFRNANGVGMKLSNFLKYDPEYKGKGLTAGSHLEKEVWSTFAGDLPRLRKAAEAILAGAKELSTAGIVIDDEEDDEADEGRILTAIHKRRERSPALVKKKKNQVLRKTGALKCAVCEFDFALEYGRIGHGFAECHHGRPVSTMKPGEKTKLADLHIVCANCHRMLHRARPWLAIDELKKLRRIN